MYIYIRLVSSPFYEIPIYNYMHFIIHEIFHLHAYIHACIQVLKVVSCTNEIVRVNTVEPLTPVCINLYKLFAIDDCINMERDC